MQGIGKSVRGSSVSFAVRVAGIVGVALHVTGCGSAVGSKEAGDEEASLASNGEALATSAFTPTLGPADVLSPDSVWYKDVSASAVAGNSAAMLAATRFGGGAPQVDFSVKVMQVSASTPKTTVQFAPGYTPDSDKTPVPVPAGGALEEETGYACTQGGDCHLIVIDPTQRKLFELWSVNNTKADGTGTWTDEDETVWWMDGHYGASGRGLGCTSADAAGLSVTAGLIGVREANAGVIRHAIRFILPNNQIRKGKAFITPATHGTSSTSSASGLPYGARLRLHAGFDATKVASKGGQAVIAALKTYGMILADAGNLAFTAESDAFYAGTGLSWSGVLSANDLRALTPGDFDVVEYDETKLGAGDDCVRTADPTTTPRSGGTPTPPVAPAPPVATTAPPVATTPPPVATTAPPVATTPPPGATTAPPVATTPPPVATTAPPTTPSAPNLLADGTFEVGTSSFRIWPSSSSSGGAPGRITAKPIDGAASMSVTLPNSNYNAFASASKTGTGTLGGAAKIRNDGASTVTVKYCVGLYDQSWNFVTSCTAYSLAPGALVNASAKYVVPSATKVQSVATYVATGDGSGSATFAVDDVYLGFGTP